MVYPRWYPTATTTPSGEIVVQGGAVTGAGGPGVLTPEIYTPDEGSGWRALDGARSQLAYGDVGGNGLGNDENRWWYPRAWVAPGNGNLYTLSGTQAYELDPSGSGRLIDRGPIPAAVRSQTTLGNPVGATSTAVMYEPGKILQVGGGAWSNGGGGAGARAGFTVDITGGTDRAVFKATAPMQYGRHWATSTILPDGTVLVTGGGSTNNGAAGFTTNPELWDPRTETWTTIEVPHERARLYHSSALLLPDGRVMVGGGGAPGPRNYTDVEFYSPAYLFEGDEPAVRPVITEALREIGYGGTFAVSASTRVSRVTLVRNGSVTHGFNNDQLFQDLTFTQPAAGRSTVDAPADGTYAPPGAYMVFVFDDSGTPSVASLVHIDPTVPMDTRTPHLVDEFEYPRIPLDWRGGNPASTITVAAGGGRMSPWTIEREVQLIRGAAPSNGGLSRVGYHLALGASGRLQRVVRGLQPGREYRVSLRYAQDSRAAAGASASLAVGSLTAALAPSAAQVSQGQPTTFGTYVGTFVAGARSEVLTLASTGTGGVVVDDLVIIGVDPGLADVPVHYEFEQGQGPSALNTGTDPSVGAATLTGGTAWTTSGVFGSGIDLPGGDPVNAVSLPDDLLLDAGDFSASLWVRPDQLTDRSALLHIGNGEGGSFQIQTRTSAPGATGLAATFMASGAPLEQRVAADSGTDLAAGRWNHVAFTRRGGTGTLFLDGVAVASRDDLTIGLADIGRTTDNWLGRNAGSDAALDGAMDEVRLYTSALTASDVAVLHADGAALRTTTAVSADPPSPQTFGTPVTVTATVSGSDGLPAQGAVELLVDGERRGAPARLVDGSHAFAPISDLARGERSLQVRFTGDDGWRSSDASTTFVVQRPPPAPGVPIHFRFDEGAGTTSANSGTDTTVGSATLQGTASWTPNGVFGTPGVDLPGGAASTNNVVRLPNDLSSGLEDAFSVSIWANPRALPNWVPLLQIGSSTDTFFLLQSSTQAAGATGFAATFKKAGNPTQERLVLGGGNDLPLNRWTHVVFTRSGSTGRIYFDGQLKATRTDFTLNIEDVGINGSTTANWVGSTSWGDPRFNGSVDDLRIYGHELSPTEIAKLYEGRAENTAPLARADGYGTAEGVVLTVPAPGVLANDSDPDHDPIAVAEAAPPTYGAVTVDADGGFTYTPAAGFTGTDTFSYTVTDGTATSTPATVRITVGPPPGPRAPISYAFDEGEGRTAANTGAHASVGPATLLGETTWQQAGRLGPAVSLPGGSAGSGNYVALPDNVTAGMDDEFAVSVWARPNALPNWVPLLQIGSSSDTFFALQSSTQANGPTGFAATFKAPDTPASAQERLTLGQGNDLPLGTWTHVVFTMSGSTGRIYFNGELQKTRTDFTIGIGDVGVAGTTTANFLGNISFPDPTFDGLIDDFRIYGHALSAAEVAELYEGSPNFAPVAADDRYRTDQDRPLTVDAPGVLGNDTDADDDALTATSATQPANGTVDLRADGSFTYTPHPGFVGVDRFTYTAHDARSASAAATVTIEVHEVVPPNRPPSGNDDAYTFTGRTLTVGAPGVLHNDTDPDGDPLTARLVDDVAHGTLRLASDGSFSYSVRPGTPNDVPHSDTFSYVVGDGAAASEVVRVTLTRRGSPKG